MHTQKNRLTHHTHSYTNLHNNIKEERHVFFFYDEGHTYIKLCNVCVCGVVVGKCIVKNNERKQKKRNIVFII